MKYPIRASKVDVFRTKSYCVYDWLASQSYTQGEGADTCVTFCYANYRTKGRVTGHCMSWHGGTVALSIQVTVVAIL